MIFPTSHHRPGIPLLLCCFVVAILTIPGRGYAQLPDLVVSDVEAPAAAGVQQDITIRWTTSNIGAGGTGSSFVIDGVYLSTDTVLDVLSDEYVGGYFHPDSLDAGESEAESTVVYLPVGLTGSFYVFVYSDDIEFVEESNEDNNLGYSNLLTISADAPDLRVTAVQAPAIAGSAEIVQVSYTVINDGTLGLTGQSWYDEVVLSPDQVFGDSGDSFLTSVFRDEPVGIGESYAETLDVYLPSGLSGSYYLLIMANYGETMYESDFTNNQGESNPISIDLFRPDLVVSALTVTDTIVAGEKLHFSYQITNQGDTSTKSQPWYDHIVFTTDSVVGNDTVLTLRFHAVNIPAGQSVTVTDSVSLPTALSPGRKHIYVECDVAEEINESDETNNIRFSEAFLYGYAGPDLEVTQVMVPPSAFSGQDIQINWIVTNTGTHPTISPSWSDRIFVSPSPVYDPLSVTLLAAFQNVSYLDSSESYGNTKTVRLPEGISGDYYIFVATDGFIQVAEMSEENNVGRNDTAMQVTLSPAPDLTVSSLIVPALAFSRETITVSYTVTNSGAAATSTPGWLDDIYLSPDTILNTATDRFLSFISHHGVLLPDSSYSGNVSIVLPNEISGPHYVFVRTDIINAVYEYTAESNNTRRSDSMSVALTPPPDLVVEAVGVPSAGYSGQPMKVTWTTENQGFTGPFEQLWYDRVYVSRTPTFIPESSYVTGTFPNPSVPDPDSGYNQHQNVLLPDGISGPFYLYVKTDHDNRVFENIYDDNNVIRSATEVTIALSPWPDLHLTVVGAPSAATAGQEIPVSWSVGNSGLGGVSTPLWSDRVYISSSATWDSASATLLKESPHSPPVDPSGSYTLSTTVKLPTTISGTYYLYYFVDAGNRVYEHTDEGNNVTRSNAVTIQPYPPVDLAVGEIVLPSSGSSGQPIAVQWIIKNVGAARTLVAKWSDAIYLSPDTVLDTGSDSLIAVVVRQGALEPGGSYAREFTVTLPNGISGNYYCIVRTDTAGAVGETTLANNVGRSSAPVSIALSPAPDLQATDLMVPPGATAGQPILVRWTVTNAGPGAVADQSWNDALTLSTDDVLDPTDRRLATITLTGPLSSGAAYDDSAEVVIPAYSSGTVYLFLGTDSRSAVYEGGFEGNNTAVQAVAVTLSPPSDLIVAGIVPPDTAFAGEEVVITWTIRNQGVNGAAGQVSDAVYISADSTWNVTDPVFGISSRNINLAPGAELELSVKGSLLKAFLSDSTGDLSGQVPGFPPGEYYVLVRTDIRNSIRETDEDNNSASSASTMTIDVPSLQIDSSTAGTLAQGDLRYYRVDVPAGQTLRIGFEADGATGNVELFARFGDVPSRTSFDVSYTSPVSPDQVIVVPETEAGTYYVLAYGDYVPGGPRNFSILAQLRTFSISAVSPPAGGNTGEVTLRVEGARFTPGSQVELVGPGGASPRLIASRTIDASRIDATFDMTGSLPLGDYDVVVVRPDSTQATLAAGFMLEPGRPHTANLGFTPPTAILRGGTGFYAITIENTSNVDLPFLMAYLVIPAGQAYTVSSSNMQTFSQLLPDSVASLGSFQDHFDFGAWRFVPVTARSVRVGQTLNIALQVRGVQGDEFPIQVFVDALDREGFIEGQLMYLEIFRQAVLADTSGMLGPEFYQLAQSPQAFTDLMLQTYVDFGILTQGDVSTVTAGRIEAASARAQKLQIDPGMLAQIMSPTLTTCQETVTWAAIGWGLGSIAVGLIAGTLLAPVTLTVAAGMAVFSAFSLGMNVGSLITERPGLLASIVCSLDPRTPTRVVASRDPNDILGPAGFGDRRWVSVDQTLPYTIRFENDPKLATAPAQVVTVNLILDSTIDVRTFRLGSFGFGKLLFSDADQRSYFTKRLDVRDSLGLYVDVASGIDIASNRVFWTFRSVNPSTGELPSDPLSGFLPVNDSTNKGEGFVTFTVRPKRTSSTGDLIIAQARIVFDVNDPIDTPPVTNTIDAGLPQSSVALLPGQTDTTSFLIGWGGEDDSAGSGLRHFTVFASANDGPYEVWLQNVTDTAGIYTGMAGNEYSFYSIASDNAGNVEPGKSSPDATTILTAVEESASGLPGAFRLHQNYPNPFNPVTTIRYELPKSAAVELLMYNVVGQVVAVLVDGPEEAGYKSVQWDARSMPSGVYFIRLTAGAFTQVKKMTLLR